MDPEKGDKDLELKDETTLDGTEEKEVTEEKKDETQLPAEKDKEHGEASRLGRRVSRIEENINRLVDELRATRTPKEREEDLPEIINTKEDVLKILEAQERRKDEGRKRYEEGYLKKLGAFTSDDDYDAVEKEMLDPANGGSFNQRITGNPEVDAELNYTKAKMSLLTKKFGTKTFRGKMETPKGGPTLPEKTATTPGKMPELDEFAQEFVKRTGMSEESTKEALGIK